MIQYHRPIKTKENLTLSIDRLIIDFYINDQAARSTLVRMLDALPIRYAVQVNHWPSYRIGSFHDNYTISMQDNNSFYLGVGLNANKPTWGRVRLEFNPNKCARHAVLLYLLEYLNVHSRRMHTVIKRFDLAIDIPVARANARLIKDRRVYNERRHGQEWTEYLGAKSSSDGRIKLYNKQAESDLPYPLTRLELTLDPATPFENLPWPKAYYITTHQVGMDEMKVTDTERFVLSALLEGHGALSDLGRRTREKLEGLLSHYVQWISINQEIYNLVLAQLQSFLNYPLIDLGVEYIDRDQPPAPLPEWVRDA